jgi:hypothetical protein
MSQSFEHFSKSSPPGYGQPYVVPKINMRIHRQILTILTRELDLAAIRGMDDQTKRTLLIQELRKHQARLKFLQAKHKRKRQKKIARQQ